MKSKYNYDKCKKEEKWMFHGVCMQRDVLNPICGLDRKKCLAYTGKIKV